VARLLEGLSGVDRILLGMGVDRGFIGALLEI